MMTEEQLAEIEELKAEMILKPLESAEDIRNWFITYLDLDFPLGVIYPESTHSPAEAAWRIYELMKTGDNKDIPQVTMLASRDSYKTLMAAAIEILCMIHFRISIAHMAAIQSQSSKAIMYVNSFFRKISKYLEANRWQKNSDNKGMVQWITDEGEDVYIRVIIATVAGANSEHCAMLFVDEVDVVQDPRALQEAKMIPCTYKQYFPLTVYLSTRKFAGGLMEKTLKETEAAGGEILRWNIIDITERITHEEAQIHKPKVLRYVSIELPMRNLSPEEYNSLNDEEKGNYEPFEAYAGIAKHPMLSVIRNRLVDRPQENVGGLYKPLVAVRNNFKQTAPEWAEAQLLCNKPSSFGLVYPRFSRHENSIELQEAWEYLTGEANNKNITLGFLVDYMHQMGIPFYAGVDWGFTDESTIVIGAVLPDGQIWIMDLISASGLEDTDLIDKYAAEFDEIYRPKRWYCDSSQPGSIKKLNRKVRGTAKGVSKNKDFVIDGLTCVQSVITDSNNVRLLKILKHGNTLRILDSFETYKWKTDGKGDPIDGVPEHGKDGVADIMDAIRYLIFTYLGKKGSFSFAGRRKNNKKETWQEKAQNYNNDLLKNRVRDLAISDRGRDIKKIKKKSKIGFSF